LIDQYSEFGQSDQFQRTLQLQAAIAAERTEYVTGEALRVDAHNRSGITGAMNESEDRFAIVFCIGGNQTELSERRGEMRVHNLELQSAFHFDCKFLC
jgi:hypothetical protein